MEPRGLLRRGCRVVPRGHVHRHRLEAGLGFDRLTVDADGVCGRRPDGRFGFTSLWLRLELDTAEDAAEARRLAERAERDCLVAASLDVPVETEIVINGR